MKKLTTLSLLILAPLVLAQEEDMESLMRVASQQARCMGAIYKAFDSKEEEQLAYSKFYSTLVDKHRTLVAYMATQQASGIPDVIEYLGSEDIMVGMLLQGTIIAADKHNDQYNIERAKKSLEEFGRYIWDINGCDAIYSTL